MPTMEGKTLLALGIDVGGTQTRWALLQGSGAILAEGQVPGFSALDLQGPGRDRAVAAMEELAAREMGRRPRRAGEQISLWRSMTGRGLDPFDEGRTGTRSGGNLPVVAAVALALFLLTSLLVYGPRLWHLPLVIGVGLLLVRRRI